MWCSFLSALPGSSLQGEGAQAEVVTERLWIGAGGEEERTGDGGGEGEIPGGGGGEGERTGDGGRQGGRMERLVECGGEKGESSLHEHIPSNSPAKVSVLSTVGFAYMC